MVKTTVMMHATRIAKNATRRTIEASDETARKTMLKGDKMYAVST